MKALLLAAGKGERLWAVTKMIPKPMVEISGKPVLEHNILMLKNSGIVDIFINLHHLPEIITYFAAINLACLHVYNLKYCQCADEECCHQDN